MRTTLTLDDDVAAKLRAEMRRSGKSFRDVVNEAIRTGLTIRAARGGRARFKVMPRDLGAAQPGISFDDVAGLIEHLEGPVHR